MDCIQPLDTYFESKLEPRRERSSHHPSSMSIQWQDRVVGACLRRSAFDWLGIVPSNPPAAIDFHRFEIGHWYEDKYEEGLKLLGLEYKREVPLKLDWGLKYPISGRVDFLVKTDGGWEGVELKSSYGRQMDYLKKNNRPKEEHLLQMLCYMEANYEGVGEIKAFNNPTIARDSYYRISFKVTKTPRGLECNGQGIPYTKEKIVERLKILENYVEKKQLPPRDFTDKNEYPCAKGSYTCPWYKECWKNG